MKCPNPDCRDGFVFRVYQVGEDDFDEGWDDCRTCNGEGTLTDEMTKASESPEAPV